MPSFWTIRHKLIIISDSWKMTQVCVDVRNRFGKPPPSATQYERMNLLYFCAPSYVATIARECDPSTSILQLSQTQFVLLWYVSVLCVTIFTRWEGRKKKHATQERVKYIRAAIIGSNAHFCTPSSSDIIRHIENHLHGQTSYSALLRSACVYRASDSMLNLCTCIQSSSSNIM